MDVISQKPFISQNGGEDRKSKAAPRLMSNAVLGMSLFVLTELMFFTALVSAFLVIKANSLGMWAPPSDVILPVTTTAFNTLVLIASGLLLFFAVRKHPSELCNTLFALATVCGAFFVGVQGYEWLGLMKHGLTMRSGMFGATFFLLIGSHALHALVAVIYMIFAFFVLQMGKKDLRSSQEMLRGVQVFWFFVVGVWPILYGLVYF